MTDSQLQIYDELNWRGLIHQATDEQHLARWLTEGPRTLYVGFDPTADSLHVGHLVAADDAAAVSAGRASADRAGRRGHGHDRRPQRQERRAQPALGRRRCGRTSPAWSRRCGGSSISTAASTAAVLVNNYDWMGRFGYLEFLRDVGKHFPGQRDARQGLGQQPAGADRRRPELHRVQLHAAAGLRFRASLRAVRLRAAGWAAATSGATSRPASTWPGGCAACSSTAAPARC